MTLTVEATYENGVLKLAQPLPLEEHEKVRVTVEPQGVPQPRAGAESTPPPIWEQIAALTRELPPGALDQMPDNLAAEHDHYLYGTPSERSERLMEQSLPAFLRIPPLTSTN